MTTQRHPGGRKCLATALMLVVLFPIAIPYCVVRTLVLRRKAQ